MKRLRGLGRLKGPAGIGLAAVLAWSAPPAGADQQGKKTETTTAAAASSLAPDKGKFRILLEDQPVGSEEFQIESAGEASSQEWLARGKTEIHLPGGRATQITAQLKLAANGAPLRYEWSTTGEKKASATVEFTGGTAKMALQMEGKQPYLQQLSFPSSRVIILDNNLYHHYAILARLYDWNAKGAQSFPVLIPQDMTPGTITVEDAGSEVLGGTTFELLRVRTADLEVHLYLDSNHRLVRLNVAGSKALIVRE